MKEQELFFNLVNVYTSTGDQTDTIWNFFVTVHLAIIAIGLIHKNVSLEFYHLIVATVGYGLFSWMNWRALGNNYELLTSIIKDIKILELENLNLYAEISFDNYDDRGLVNIIAHLIGGAIFLIVFISAYRGTNKFGEPDR